MSKLIYKVWFRKIKERLIEDLKDPEMRLFLILASFILLVTIAMAVSIWIK